MSVPLLLTKQQKPPRPYDESVAVEPVEVLLRDPYPPAPCYSSAAEPLSIALEPCEQLRRVSCLAPCHVVLPTFAQACVDTLPACTTAAGYKPPPLYASPLAYRNRDMAAQVDPRNEQHMERRTKIATHDPRSPKEEAALDRQWVENARASVEAARGGLHFLAREQHPVTLLRAPNLKLPSKAKSLKVKNKRPAVHKCFDRRGTQRRRARARALLQAL